MNKGDDLEPDIRSRLVAREIRQAGDEAIFAPTPPLESLRYVLSNCASTIDVKRTYFYAPVRTPIFIVLPAEDRLPGDEGMVG